MKTRWQNNWSIYFAFSRTILPSAQHDR